MLFIFVFSDCGGAIDVGVADGMAPVDCAVVRDGVGFGLAAFCYIWWGSCFVRDWALSLFV